MINAGCVSHLAQFADWLRNFNMTARVGLMTFIGLQCAIAQSAAWSSVGSTGTVDEADSGYVVYNGAEARVLSSAPLPYTVNITYPVVAVDGLLSTLSGKFVKARFTDNGTAARVILTLKEYDVLTGILRTRLTFDSDSYPATTSSQVVTKRFCTTEGTSWNFDFTAKLYYVEAQIVRSNLGGTSSLFAVQVGKTGC